MTSKLLFKTVGVTAAVALGLLANALPANADGPLQITGKVCYQTTGSNPYGNPSSRAQMECEFDWTGGTGAITIAYTGNTVLYDYQNGLVDTYCGGIYIHLTDSLGATATAYGYTTCQTEAP